MTLSTPSLLLSLDTATLSYPPLSPPQPLSPTSLSLHTYQSINQSIFISLSLRLSPFIDLNAQGPLGIFPQAKVAKLVETLELIRERAAA